MQFSWESSKASNDIQYILMKTFKNDVFLLLRPRLWNFQVLYSSSDLHCSYLSAARNFIQFARKLAAILDFWNLDNHGGNIVAKAEAFLLLFKSPFWPKFLNFGEIKKAGVNPQPCKIKKSGGVAEMVAFYLFVNKLFSLANSFYHECLDLSFLK